MSECIFCDKWIDRSVDSFELPGIEHFFFLTDMFPATAGHTLVIPKRHVVDFRELNSSEQNELYRAVRFLYDHLDVTDLSSRYKLLKNEFEHDKPEVVPFITDVITFLNSHRQKPEGYNHGLNDGVAAGRTIHHFHYHVMPRWTGDSENAAGGIRHMFSGKGTYKK